MANVLLISPKFIKDMTPANDQLSDKYLQSAIMESQDVELQGVLGSTLYNKIIQLVAEKKISLESNAVYKSILDKSQYMLAYYAIEKVILSTSVKVSNIGATQTNDENITNLGVKDMITIQKMYRDKADFYTIRLQDYLRENSSLIPELWKNNQYGMQTNLESTESSGIWLGGSVGRGHYSKKKKIGYDK